MMRDIFTTSGCEVNVLGQASVQCPDFCHRNKLCCSVASLVQ